MSSEVYSDTEDADIEEDYSTDSDIPEDGESQDDYSNDDGSDDNQEDDGSDDEHGRINNSANHGIPDGVGDHEQHNGLKENKDDSECSGSGTISESYSYTGSDSCDNEVIFVPLFSLIFSFSKK